MQYKTPEECGLSSENIIKYIKKLEERELSNHSLIMARGDNIIFEGYWDPVDENFLHRQYSTTKSFTSIAIGFLEQDGLICLDDPLFKYFPEESKNQTDEYMKTQTIRDMLKMSTAKFEHIWWFGAGIHDRLQSYFDNDRKDSRPPSTIYNYDSQGSFVLGTLVERVTKMTVTDYLYEKLFRKIGVSDGVHMLKCPGGHSWADSALLCTAMDLFKVARFVLNKGKWEGVQILNEEYLNEATKKQIDNNMTGRNTFDSQGYGYQIWKTYHDGFFFNGAACQFAICMPKKDFIMVYNADNFGKATAKEDVFNNFFDIIYDNISDVPLPENREANEELENLKKSLTLNVAKGEKTTDFVKKINGAKFILGENKMGISEFTLKFEEDEGEFQYVNAQGHKTIKFGMGKNIFGLFPEEGYSNDVGTEKTKGFYYKYGASAAWTEEKRLFIKLHILDRYLGNSNIIISFKDEDNVGVYMESHAEAFLTEYSGIAGGKRMK